jgi:hypothetical protein
MNAVLKTQLEMAKDCGGRTVRAKHFEINKGTQSLNGQRVNITTEKNINLKAVALHDQLAFFVLAFSTPRRGRRPMVHL